MVCERDEWTPKQVETFYLKLLFPFALNERTQCPSDIDRRRVRWMMIEEIFRWEKKIQLKWISIIMESDYFWVRHILELQSRTIVEWIWISNISIINADYCNHHDWRRWSFWITSGTHSVHFVIFFAFILQISLFLFKTQDIFWVFLNLLNKSKNMISFAFVQHELWLTELENRNHWLMIIILQFAKFAIYS